MTTSIKLLAILVIFSSFIFSQSFILPLSSRIKTIRLGSNPETPEYSRRPDNNDGKTEKLIKFGGKNYYEGLLNEPVASETADQLDNLTPNLKLIGIMSGVIFGSVIAFFAANKDIPPPSF